MNKEKYLALDTTYELPTTLLEDMVGQIRFVPSPSAGRPDRVVVVAHDSSGGIRYFDLGGIVASNYFAGPITGETFMYGLDTIRFDQEWFQFYTYAPQVVTLQGVPPVVTGSLAQSSADVATNASTVNYVNAGSMALTLPYGVWTVNAIGGVLIQNTGGSANTQISIDGNLGGARSLSVATEAEVVTNHVVPDLEGNRIILVNLRYKCSAAGTTSARNPWLWVTATRQQRP